MPYVCEQANRYIGEHNCARYHYGDQTMVRDCCIADAQRYKAMALRNAMTTSHAAYRQFEAAWNSLTDAERQIVGDIVAVYDHGPAGFKERPLSISRSPNSYCAPIK